MEKSNKKNISYFLMEITLILVLPLLIISFDFAETTGLYDKVNNFDEMERIIQDRYLTNYEIVKMPTIDRSEEDFKTLWKLIKANTLVDIGKEDPYAISAFAINNMQSVKVPVEINGSYIVKDMYFFPDQTPMVAIYTHPMKFESTSNIPFDEAIIFGTLGDLKKWIDLEKTYLKIRMDAILSLISITIGLFLFRREKYKIG
ncbi:hypothetical protein KAR91_60050 [Candidatus Pacearchaeota archaeon]|nr:hypothetical protein [Candidatus Pacearchaeota archaeon]